MIKLLPRRKGVVINPLIVLSSSLWSAANVSFGQTQLKAKEQSTSGDAVHEQPLEAWNRGGRRKQGNENYPADISTINIFK